MRSRDTGLVKHVDEYQVGHAGYEQTRNLDESVAAVEGCSQNAAELIQQDGVADTDLAGAYCTGLSTSLGLGDWVSRRT